MGISWMANIFGADLGGPVVVFNATLNKTVVYAGNERGDVIAVDASTGNSLWSTNVGLNDSLRATPAVSSDGSVWVGTHYNPTIYKLNGATGAVECSSKTAFGIDGSLAIATPPGGVESVYYDTVDGAPISGPTVALRANDCSTLFSFSNYLGVGGGWVTPAYAVDAKQEPMVYVGTANPDDTMYAIDGVTGNLVWDYNTNADPNLDYDIGSAATVSPPGNNGFSDGVLYFNSKLGYVWAVDLTTGTLIWQTNLFPQGGQIDIRSGAALDGNTLVVGSQNGVTALNATTGAILWHYTTPLEVVSSPAIAGSSGNEVVAFGDIDGTFRVIRLSDGSPLYTHQTGGYITASAAEANGNVYITSSDGFLYSFAAGGGNAAPPSTSISSPANSSKVANPNGALTISGSSSDNAGVGAVEVALQTNGPSGQWYDAATNTYGSAPIRNLATLASPGASSTTWSFQFPAPAAGGTFYAHVNTVNTSHVADHGGGTSFQILPSSKEAYISAPSTVTQPGGALEVTGHSFAAGEKVAYSLFGAVVKTVQTSKGGYVPTTRIPVASSATLGPTSITATGLTSGITTTLSITIANQWTQLGYGSTRNSYEPHDNIITKAVGIGRSTVLSQAWLYPTGAPVHTSPAVVNGVAYIGNDAGTLSAVLTNSGGPEWTFTIPSQAMIHSSPAVDASGNVIFGADDGNLYILGPLGALVQTTALGGRLNSTALAGGEIYITSDNGNMYALADPTGAMQWTAPLSGPSHSSPAYDAANNIVVAGDDSGAVTALNATTGAQLWKVSTGGAVTANPAIINGTVVVGSNSGTLYDLNEKTGAQNFTFQADSAILDGPALFSLGQISFGTKNGTLYQLSGTGQLVYAQASSFFKNNGIVGVAAVPNNVASITTNGFLGLSRNNPAELPWSFQTGTTTSMNTTPAILDGALYVGAADGGLYAFTPHGVLPMTGVRGGPVISVTDAWTCTTQQ